VAISTGPSELRDLIVGSHAIHQALGGSKEILAEEQPTIDFAYACVVTTAPIRKGEIFSKDNLWVKRPGTGQIMAEEYDKMLGRRASRDILADVHLQHDHVE